MLRIFSGPTHKDSDELNVSTVIAVIVQDPASCCAATREALLFRLSC